MHSRKLALNNSMYKTSPHGHIFQSIEPYDIMASTSCETMHFIKQFGGIVEGLWPNSRSSRNAKLKDIDPDINFHIAEYYTIKKTECKSHYLSCLF